MGGCATKPKVLKGEDDVAPIPEQASAPVTVKEGYEANEVVNGEEEEETKVTTHEDGAKIDGGKEEKVEAEGGDALKGHKPHSRSLSNLLFDQSELEKEKPVISSEPVVDEEKLKTETTTPAAELESKPVVKVASEEKPVTDAEVLTGETKEVVNADDVKVTEEADVLTGETKKVVNAEEVEVTEKAAEDDQIQKTLVLPADSAPKV